MAEDKEEKKKPADGTPKESGAEPKKASGKPEPSGEQGAPAAPTSPGISKKKKVGQMTLAEIDSKLADIKSSQGGLKSKFAKHLLRRKSFLEKQ